MKILLTEGSSTSARQTLFALGGKHTIDILDPSPVCQCRFSRFVRRVYRCPPFARDPAAYLAFLVARLKAERYDVLFPTHEQVYLLSRFREPLGRLAAFAVPEFAAVEQMIDKARFLRLLDKLGLPRPPTVIVQTKAELLATAAFPRFVKVAMSTAGEGVRLVHDRAELTRVADEFDRAGLLDGQTEILVQQRAIGTKACMAGIFDQGRLVARHFDDATAIGVGGSSLGRVSVDDPVAGAHLERFGRHLGWHGAAFIEYFRDPASGAVQYIECNPRIGETVNCTLAGINLCEQWLRVALGEPVEPAPLPRLGVRTHQGFLALLALALRGGTRRQLMGELFRRWAGRDFYRDAQNELTRPRQDWLSMIPSSAVTLLLLARPNAAQWLVSRTVNNYALTGRAAAIIRSMPADKLPEEP